MKIKQFTSIIIGIFVFSLLFAGEIFLPRKVHALSAREIMEKVNERDDG